LAYDVVRYQVGLEIRPSGIVQSIAVIYKSTTRGLICVRCLTAYAFRVTVSGGLIGVQSVGKRLVGLGGLGRYAWPATRASNRRIARSPNSNRGWRIVVRGGAAYSARSISSTPITPKSSGTRPRSG